MKVTSVGIEFALNKTSLLANSLHRQTIALNIHAGVRNPFWLSKCIGKLQVKVRLVSDRATDIAFSGIAK